MLKFTLRCGRNPFVNQVGWFPNLCGGMGNRLNGKSQSLRKSGRLVHMTLEEAFEKMLSEGRNPFVNQVGWFVCDSLNPIETPGRNPFVNQVGWFPTRMSRGFARITDPCRNPFVNQVGWF